MEKMFLILIFFLIVMNAFCLFMLFKMKDKKKSVSEFMKKILSCVNSVRYGKLSERIIIDKNLDFKEITDSINRMIETLEDREKMIVEYQKAMQEKNQALEEHIKKEHDIEQLRKDFVATVGHDLKVPIIAESNTLDFLLEGIFGELNAKQVEALTKMKNSNSELIELVENLLETYKTQDNLVSIEKTLVNLNQLLSDVAGEMQSVASGNNQQINCIFEEGLVEVYVDPFQLKRVIKNLLLNSISFCPKDSEIELILKTDEKNVFLSVVDYGPGIDENDVEHIFDKYYSCAKKFRKVGTGLGLYLAKKIVLAHGGDVIVQSVPYEKTEFKITLKKLN